MPGDPILLYVPARGRVICFAWKRHNSLYRIRMGTRLSSSQVSEGWIGGESGTSQDSSQSSTSLRTQPTGG